jgi:hypothetical protein
MSTISASLAREPKLKTTLKLVDATLSAYQRWLRDTWAVYSKNPLYVTTSDSVTSIKQLVYESNDVQYPTVILAPAGIQLNTDRAGLRSRYTSITGVKDYDKKTAVLYNLTPIKAGYGMQVRSDSMDDLMLFSSMIYQAMPGPSIIIQHKGGFEFESKISFPTDLDITSNSDPNKFFSIDMSIVFSSWLGIFDTVGLIDTLKFQYRIFDTIKTMELVYDEDLKEYLPPVEQTQVSTYTDSFDTSSPLYAGNSKDITGE